MPAPGSSEDIEPTAFGSAIAASVTGVLARKTEASSLALRRFRETFDNAWQCLEQSEADEASSKEVSKLIEQLTQTMSGQLQAVEQVRAEADVRVKTAIAETKRQRHEIARLSAGLEETRADFELAQRAREAARGQAAAAAAEAERLREEATQAADSLKEVQDEAGRLRIELETERRQASAMVLEVGQNRLAAERAHTALEDVAAELAKETRDRQALESRLLATMSLLDTTRKEASATRQRLRDAVAEALKLVDTADVLTSAVQAPVAAGPNGHSASPPAEPHIDEALVDKSSADASLLGLPTMETLELTDFQPEPPGAQVPSRNAGATDSPRYFRRRLAAMVRG